MLKSICDAQSNQSGSWDTGTSEAAKWLLHLTEVGRSNQITISVQAHPIEVGKLNDDSSCLKAATT